jgi:ankyrin repeat protein
MQFSKRAREWVLLALGGILAVLANLPQPWLDQIGANRNWLLAILGLLVFIGFQFFILVVLLVLGANMPAEISEKLGISTLPLIIAMVAMVGISLINYIVDLLPTGLEEKPKEQSPEGIKALFYAIEKGNLVYAQKVLSMNFDPNLRAENGYTPLMYAAARGDAKMCELFLRNGAEVGIMSAEGDTAIELALRVGSDEVAELLKAARAEQLARAEAEKARAKAA